MQEFHLSVSVAIQVELLCEQVATAKIAPKGNKPLSPEVKDAAVGKIRSRALDILRENREKNIPPGNVLEILQTADWGK